MAGCTAKLPRLFWLLRWPILGKELRVASRRRRRTYVLRAAYVGLLTVFVVLAWRNAVRDIGGSGYPSPANIENSTHLAQLAYLAHIHTREKGSGRSVAAFGREKGC